MIKCTFCDKDGKSEIYMDQYICESCLSKNRQKNFFDELKEIVDKFLNKKE